MSDDFVPLNQSTPTGGKWQGQVRYQRNNWQMNWSLNGQRRGNNRWRNNSQRNSSFCGIAQFIYIGHIVNEELKDDWDIEREHGALSVGGNMLAQRFAGVKSVSNSSISQEKVNIDAYLHPSMLQDPWVPLRKWLDENKK